MASATIRLAVPGDAGSVLELWRRAGLEESATDDLDSVRRAASSGILVVAGEGGAVIGTLIAAFDGWRGNLYRLAVDPEHRRRGIGRALVTYAEHRLAGRGCTRITALVRRDEEHARDFWKAAGYRHDVRMARHVKTTDR
jgi:ribosomal protein S18 acetylase RimI-like enzyme